MLSQIPKGRSFQRRGKRFVGITPLTLFSVLFLMKFNHLPASLTLVAMIVSRVKHKSGLYLASPAVRSTDQYPVSSGGYYSARTFQNLSLKIYPKTTRCCTFLLTGDKKSFKNSCLYNYTIFELRGCALLS